MQNITVNNDGSIATVVTYTPDQIAQMKADSDVKLAELQADVSGEQASLAKAEQALADEQTHNDELASWTSQSQTAIATSQVSPTPPIESSPT